MAARKSKSVASSAATKTPALRMAMQSASRTSSPYSLNAMVNFFSNNAGLIFMALSILIVGFLSGSLWTENRMLKKAVSVAGVTTTATTAQATAQTPAAPAAPTITMDQVRGLFTSDHITFGDKNSKLVFTEFSDPSCPYCHIAAGKNPDLNKSAGAQFTLVSQGGTYDPPVEEMRKLVDAGQAAFVWVYSNGHGDGEDGMRALYCANENGKFWQVHDLLMSAAGYDLQNNKIKNDKTQYQALADFLKPAIDPTVMKNCLDSGKYDGKIASDQALSQQFGVNGTPGFFVNTTNFAGAYSYKDMESTVAQVLK